jgi:hypothetical protein
MLSGMIHSKRIEPMCRGEKNLQEWNSHTDVRSGAQSAGTVLCDYRYGAKRLVDLAKRKKVFLFLLLSGVGIKVIK